MHSSDFLSRFGIHLPIMQAPMAGGSNTPELVAACCNAGILGSLGVPYTEPDEIERTLNAIRKLTDRPFNVNVFAPGRDTELKGCRQPALEFLRPLYEQLGTHCPEIPKISTLLLDDELEL